MDGDECAPSKKKLRELNARTGSMIFSRSSQIGTKHTSKYIITYQKAKQTTATTTATTTTITLHKKKAKLLSY